MRGEYPTHATRQVPQSELPPRARRILIQLDHGLPAAGTTSACAENTPHTPLARCRNRNYLRVRGEYAPKSTEPVLSRELPPRARRIRAAHQRFYCTRGTTSACAENTNPFQQQHYQNRNYLRVRGEYLTIVKMAHNEKELPPRARRIRRHPPNPTPTRGTTSACAENTPSFRYPVNQMWNYLRVRGEYKL